MNRGEVVTIYNLYGQFEEIALLLADTLQRRGYRVARTRDLVYDERLYVLFGSNVWEDAVLLPHRFIVYQLEQSPIQKWFIPAYFTRLALALQVWDYNLQNVAYLRQRGIEAIHLPIGYSPIFDPPATLLAQRESIDVLFLGQLRNTHRQQVVAQLRASGLNVVARNDAFGIEKHRLVAQAKVVLNLHYGGKALLEEARIVPLLASGKVVISESVRDASYMSLYADYVCFANDFAQLLALCRQWCACPPRERAARGALVRNWVRTSRNVLALTPWVSIEREAPPRVPFYPSLLQVPPATSLVFVERALHQSNPEWQAQRHYGCRSLMVRI